MCEGWICFDIQEGEGVDVIHDLEEKFDFGDNTFEKVHASYVFEHVLRWERLSNENISIVEEKENWNKNALKMEELFKRLVSEKV